MLSRIIQLIREMRRKSPERILFSGKTSFRKVQIIENNQNDSIIMYALNRRFVAGISKSTGLPLYTPYFLSDLYVESPKNFLFLGGGPNATPSYVWRNYKPDSIDVVEWDQKVTDLAYKYFDIPRSQKYRIHNTDAWVYINSTEKKYDVIFVNLGMTSKRGSKKGDLHNLVTKQGIQILTKRMEKNGVIVYNCVGKMTGGDLTFLRKLYTALKIGCRRVDIYSSDKAHKNKTQAITFTCTNNVRKDAGTLGFIKHQRGVPIKTYRELMDQKHVAKVIKSGLVPFTN